MRCYVCTKNVSIELKHMHFINRAILLVFEISLLVSFGSSECSSRCDTSALYTLYQNSFAVFGAWHHRHYGVGETLIIVTRFPAYNCWLPEPQEVGPQCVPLLSVGLHLFGGEICLPIAAAKSTRQVEIDYGIKFYFNSTLDNDKMMNFWAFPLDVREGMYTARLNVLGFTVPSSCNVTGRAIFSERDFVPNSNRMLWPNVSVDTWPPKILNVYTGTEAGSYTLLEVIKIVVVFSKPVFFSELPSKFDTTFMKANASYTIPAGLPYLELNSQAFALLEGYAAGSVDRRKLSFVYVVGTGEYTPAGGQLEVPAGGTIQLNGNIIASTETGVEADLTTMPLPGTYGAPVHADTDVAMQSYTPI